MKIKLTITPRSRTIILAITKFLTKHIYMILAIFWLLFIFMLSGQPGESSSELSKSVNNSLSNLSLFKKLFMYIPVRKCAHMFLYFVLGCLVYTELFFNRPEERISFINILSFDIVYICAAADEIHQYFVPGRSCLLADTFIDQAGCVLGLLFINIIFYLYFCVYQNYKDHKILRLY